MAKWLDEPPKAKGDIHTAHQQDKRDGIVEPASEEEKTADGGQDFRPPPRQALDAHGAEKTMYLVTQGVIFLKPGLDPASDTVVRMTRRVGQKIHTTGKTWTGSRGGIWAQIDSTRRQNLLPRSQEVGWILVTGPGFGVKGPVLLEDSQSLLCKVKRVRTGNGKAGTQVAEVVMPKSARVRHLVDRLAEMTNLDRFRIVLTKCAPPEIEQGSVYKRRDQEDSESKKLRLGMDFTKKQDILDPDSTLQECNISGPITMVYLGDEEEDLPKRTQSSTLDSDHDGIMPLSNKEKHYQVLQKDVKVRSDPRLTGGNVVGYLKEGSIVSGRPYSTDRCKWIKLESAECMKASVEANCAWVLMDGRSRGLGLMLQESQAPQDGVGKLAEQAKPTADYAHFEVVNARVAIRSQPSTGATCLGGLTAGQVVAGLPYSFEQAPWLRLGSEQCKKLKLGSESAWMLIHGGVMGIGQLLRKFLPEEEDLEQQKEAEERRARGEEEDYVEKVSKEGVEATRQASVARASLEARFKEPESPTKASNASSSQAASPVASQAASPAASPADIAIESPAAPLSSNASPAPASQLDEAAEETVGPVSTWTIEDVTDFIEMLGFGHVVHEFETNGVDGEMLLSLDEADMCEELHLTRLQARKVTKMLKRFKA